MFYMCCRQRCHHEDVVQVLAHRQLVTGTMRRSRRAACNLERAHSRCSMRACRNVELPRSHVVVDALDCWILQQLM